jgi:hypothetical protein
MVILYAALVVAMWERYFEDAAEYLDVCTGQKFY